MVVEIHVKNIYNVTKDKNQQKFNEQHHIYIKKQTKMSKTPNQKIEYKEVKVNHKNEYKYTQDFDIVYLVYTSMMKIDPLILPLMMTFSIIENHFYHRNLSVVNVLKFR